jgi:predicted Zn-dependent protease with MMP-like domain
MAEVAYMKNQVPPSLDDIAKLAREAFASIPDAFRSHVRNVEFLVEEFPSDDICDEMGAESAFDILGLYAGVPFGFKSVSSTPGDLDRIFLFRRPILDYWCETGEELSHIVRHVLVHEIGHHFGFSDEDMERIEAGQSVV